MLVRELIKALNTFNPELDVKIATIVMEDDEETRTLLDIETVAFDGETDSVVIE